MKGDKEVKIGEKIESNLRGWICGVIPAQAGIQGKDAAGIMDCPPSRIMTGRG